MDDIISRQAAITAIQNAYCDTEGGEDKCAVWKNVGLTEALHIMQDLLSAQPEPQWIPCSEKLPEVGTVCLACGKNRGIYVARLDYDGNRYYWIWLGVTREVKPIAWMPLPERYKHE